MLEDKFLSIFKNRFEEIKKGSTYLRKTRMERLMKDLYHVYSIPKEKCSNFEKNHPGVSEFYEVVTMEVT